MGAGISLCRRECVYLGTYPWKYTLGICDLDVDKMEYLSI